MSTLLLQWMLSRNSFGHDNKLLGDAARSSTLRDNLSKLLLGVKFNQRFPWILDGLEMLPLTLENPERDPTRA